VDEPRAFREFEARYRREYGIFYEFLLSFYDMNADEGSYFWKAKKVTESSGSELEAFVELVGGIASGESALVNAEDVAQRVMSASTEFTNEGDQLVMDSGGSIMRLVRSPVLGPALLAVAGQDDGKDEYPVYADGLVASPDGLLWSSPT
jgi:halogenation protein CepH